jgi:hypothetical protein
MYFKQATPLTMSQRTNTRENIANDPLNSDVTGKDISVTGLFDAYENWCQVGLKHTLFG